MLIILTGKTLVQNKLKGYLPERLATALCVQLEIQDKNFGQLTVQVSSVGMLVSTHGVLV